MNLDYSTNPPNKYSDFNVEQLSPILADLKLSVKIIHQILCSLDDYTDSLYELQNEIKNCGLITNEIKVQIDKNVSSLLHELAINLNQMIHFKNMGSRKEKLFERLKRGLNYKYKLSNGSIVENPELLKFDVLRLDMIHRTIEIGNKIFQFSDSADYAPEGGDDSCPLELRPFVEPETLVVNCIKQFQAEIKKVLTIKAYLDVLLVTIQYAHNSIITDITHFNLINKECFAHDNFEEIEDLDKC